MMLNLLLAALLIVSPAISIKYHDNKSSHENLLKGNCSIESCISRILSPESPSSIVTFVARTELNSGEKLVLKFEHNDENSALKVKSLPFDVKLLTEYKTSQKC